MKRYAIAPVRERTKPQICKFLKTVVLNIANLQTQGIPMSKTPKVQFLNRQTPPHIFTLVMLASIGAMSMNMFLPSLPAMTDHFQTDYRITQLSVALYLGMSGVVHLVVGPLSDRFGRRPIVLISLAIFVATAIGCVYAPNIETFLVFRMVQASVATGLVLSRAMIRDMVPNEEAASMIGYVTMGMSIIPMLSPALGGFLDANFGWQANFWTYAILGMGVLVLAWADSGETSTTKFSSFSAQFSQYPELLTSPRFWGYALAAMFASGSFFAYLGGAPFVGAELYGLSPERLGMFFGAPAVGYLVGNFVSGRFSQRIGMQRMVWLGSLINFVGMATSLLIFLFGFGTVTLFFGFMTFVGLGNGMVLPNANAGMMSVRPHLAGSAAGLGGAMMIGGGALLSALSGSILSTETGVYPLLWIMGTSALCSILAILYVIKRDAQIGETKDG